MAIGINVTPNKVTITEQDIINQGEFNVNECNFTFSSEYDNLIKRAVFTTLSKYSYLVEIENDKCTIPQEILMFSGLVYLGVYAYENDIDNKLKLRYSPEPTNFNIAKGSYVENCKTVIPPEKATDLMKEVSELVIEVQRKLDNREFDGEDGVGIADIIFNADYSMTIILTDGQVINSMSLRGAKGETGDKGDTGEPGTTNYDELDNKPTKLSDFANDSGFITKDVNNLTNYTKTGDMTNAINTAVINETIARENSDVTLQNQIDAITSASDVVDVVGTYTELQNYDTAKLTDKDLIKVMQDSTHNNALSYYRWLNTSWAYVGSEGPFYTKSESNALLNAKQDEIDANNKLASDLVDDTNSGNKFVTTSEKQSWNDKLDAEDLTDYVKKTNYATSTTPGLVYATNSMNYGNIGVSNTGMLYLSTLSGNSLKTAVQSHSRAIPIMSGNFHEACEALNIEGANNKVTTIDSNSTDTEYPSAKCVYDSLAEKVNKSSFVYDSITETLTITI